MSNEIIAIFRESIALLTNPTSIKTNDKSPKDIAKAVYNDYKQAGDDLRYAFGAWNGRK